MSCEEVVVLDCEGERLVGIFHQGETATLRIALVFVVGGPQYRVGSHRQFVTSARFFAQAGIPVLRFDVRGMGDSSGDAPRFEHVSADIRAGITEIRRRLPDHKLVLLGLCDGASAILIAEHAHKSADGVVLINPWVRTPALAANVMARHYYLGRIAEGAFWRGLFSLRVNPFKALRELVDTLWTARARGGRANRRSFVETMIDALDQMRVPVLIALSGDDLTAREFETLSEIDARLKTALERANMSTVRFAGADHTFSQREDLRRFNEETLAWLTREIQPHSRMRQ